MSYHQQPLGSTLSICVSPAHTFGTDGFLLSHFARAHSGDRVCDLGTGCGIVALLWYRNREQAPAQTVCVDIQPQAIDQLRETVAQNSLEGRVFPLVGDLRKATELPAPGSFDLVTCNPPYQVVGTGLLSESPSDRLARHEISCSLWEVCQAAARLVRFGGRFCLCQRPERLADVLAAMRESGLEPKRLRFVQQRSGVSPWLLLAEGKRGAKPSLQVEPPLIFEDENGLTDEVLAIYQKTRQPGERRS